MSVARAAFNFMMGAIYFHLRTYRDLRSYYSLTVVHFERVKKKIKQKRVSEMILRSAQIVLLDSRHCLNSKCCGFGLV